METKKFTKFTIASIKRTAQNVYPLVRRKNKLMETIREAQEEIEQLKLQIDSYQTPIKAATGGYTTEDLIDRIVTTTDKVDKEGNPIKVTQFVLKYPETVVPVITNSVPDADENPKDEQLTEELRNEVFEQEHQDEPNELPFD